MICEFVINKKISLEELESLLDLLMLNHQGLEFEPDPETDGWVIFVGDEYPGDLTGGGRTNVRIVGKQIFYEVLGWLAWEIGQAVEAEALDNLAENILETPPTTWEAICGQVGLAHIDPSKTPPTPQESAKILLNYLIDADAIEVEDIDTLAEHMVPILESPFLDRAKLLSELFLNDDAVEEVFIDEENLRAVLEAWG